MIDLRSIHAALPTLTEAEQRDLAARLAFLLGTGASTTITKAIASLDKPAALVYSLTCDELRQRGVNIPTIEGRTSIAYLANMNNGLATLRTATDAVVALMDMMHAPKAARLGITRSLIRLTCERLDAARARSMTLRDVKYRIEQARSNLIGKANVRRVIGLLSDIIDNLSKTEQVQRNQHGVPAVLRTLAICQSIIHESFPGYPLRSGLLLKALAGGDVAKDEEIT